MWGKKSAAKTRSGLYPDAMREPLEEMWFAEIAKIVKGKDSGDFTPEDWGKVRAELKTWDKAKK